MRLQGLVNYLNRLRLMLFDYIKESLELVEGCFKQRSVGMVDHKGDWQNIENILLTDFAKLLNALKHLVFLCEALVVFKVVYKVFLSVFAKKFEIYVRGVWCPFEIEKGNCVWDLLPGRTYIHNSLY